MHEYCQYTRNFAEGVLVEHLLQFGDERVSCLHHDSPPELQHVYAQFPGRSDNIDTLKLELAPEQESEHF